MTGNLSTLNVRLATQLLRDLGQAHPEVEVVANLHESAPKSVREAAFEEVDVASRIVDAYPATLILALANQVEPQLGTLPGNNREQEVSLLQSLA